MTQEVTIVELIRNGTLSAEMAGVLWAAVDEKISFLTSAVYRNAGKTTLSKAVLSLRSNDVPIHYIADNPKITEKLLALEKHGGYLVVQEFSPADVPGYIWGEDVEHVFKMVKKGYSLQGSLHADSAEEAMLELTKENDVRDEDASIVKLVIFIEMFGTTYTNIKRRVTEMFEVHYVEGGKALGHNLFSWSEENDSFKKIEEPHQFARNTEEVKRRGEVLGYLASLGKNSPEDVAKAVSDFKKEQT